MIPDGSKNPLLKFNRRNSDRTDNGLCAKAAHSENEVNPCVGSGIMNKSLTTFLKSPDVHAGHLPVETILQNHPPIRWGWISISMVLVVVVLTLLPQRTSIAPMVESDYCYLLTAADRFYDGQGLTATSPVAPNQPWHWSQDWSFVTKWPMGYPLLVWTFRSAFGFSTIQACQWISLVSCALALVGWFVFIKRALPDGITGTLLASVAAGCSVTTASLINPSSDIIVVAILPWILLCISTTIPTHPCNDFECDSQKITLKLAFIGVVSGMIFWMRFAGIFIPIAISVYLFMAFYFHRVIRFRHWLIYSGFAFIPVVSLLMINQVFGSSESVQTQLNLGTSIQINFSLALLTHAWSNFTKFGFYDYVSISQGLYAFWPVIMMFAVIFIRPLRNRISTFIKMPAIGLSICLVTTLLIMLVTATAVFGDKYNYVGLQRYYLTVKPLYFLLFVGPLCFIPRRLIRIILCVAMIVCCNWLIRVEWSKPYSKWLAADRPVTDYGQWSRCFEPDANSMYRWLHQQANPYLIVVSNFHEYIMLETKIPTIPIPKDMPTLNRWIERICESRSITDPRVLFVLNPDNQWRNYWIPEPDVIIQKFQLKDRINLPAHHTTLIYPYTGQNTTNSEYLHIANK